MDKLDEKMRLSEEFLSQYKGKQPKWGFDGLGYIVYLRTYARPKEDGALEQWWETIKRITEGNFNIHAKRLIEIGKWNQEEKEKLTKEMERFYHVAFNLIATPPGRGMWMSGTEYAERVGDAENNCWAVSMRPQSYMPGETQKVSFASVFTFDQAMKGGGVGVNIQRKYVSQIPRVNNKVVLDVFCHSKHTDFGKIKDKIIETRHENYKKTDIFEDNYITRDYTEGYFSETNNTIEYVIEDSRQGWAKALQYIIDAHYEKKKYVMLDISYIRPYGALIKGFGGVASGPGPLIDMLNRVNEILNNRVGDFVTPTEWGDVIQNIGCCVVAGNVRRTALILIGDNDDKEFVESKNYDLLPDKTPTQWRWASNNSVDIGADADYDTLKNLAVNIYYNGEPGYTNICLARNFGRIIDGFQKDIDGEVEAFNP